MDDQLRFFLLKCEKGAGLVLIVLHMAALFAVIRWAWPDIPPSGWALAALTAAVVVMPEIYLVERLCGIRGAFDFRGIGKAYVIIFGLVYLLTVGLFTMEVISQRNSEAFNKQVELDRKAFYDKISHINHP